MFSFCLVSFEKRFDYEFCSFPRLFISFRKNFAALKEHFSKLSKAQKERSLTHFNGNEESDQNMVSKYYLYYKH